jgi:hypothetical protein
VAEVFQGTVEIQDDAADTVAITLNGNTADVRLGGNGRAGNLVIRDAAGNERVRIDGGTGEISIFGTAETEVLKLTGTGEVIAGGGGRGGELTVREQAGEDRVRLEARTATGWVGGNGSAGDLVIFPSSGDNASPEMSTIALHGGTAELRLGATDARGSLVMNDSSGQPTIQLRAGVANLRWADSIAPATSSSRARPVMIEFVSKVAAPKPGSGATAPTGTSWSSPREGTTSPCLRARSIWAAVPETCG